MIPVISDLETDAVDEPVVAMDGELHETLPLIRGMARRLGYECLGITAVAGFSGSFHAAFGDSMSLTDEAAIRRLKDRFVDLVVIGPTALLGSVAEERITQLVREAIPNVRVVCATGIRTDLELFTDVAA